LDVEAAYVAALDDQGLLAEFAAPRQAVTTGRAVCERIDAGEQARGTEAEAIAVQFFCDDYSSAFEVLNSETVHVGITLHAPCSTIDFYFEASATSPVVVLDDDRRGAC
jgi:hypothetical protein